MGELNFYSLNWLKNDIVCQLDQYKRLDQVEYKIILDFII